MKGGGSVDFTEFMTLMTKQRQESDTPDELKEAFKLFDKDGNGIISASDLRQVMTNLGQVLTDEDIREMIFESDIDGDGQISYDGMLIVLHTTYSYFRLSLKEKFNVAN